jgi:hypothetical protein
MFLELNATWNPSLPPYTIQVIIPVYLYTFVLQVRANITRVYQESRLPSKIFIHRGNAVHRTREQHKFPRHHQKKAWIVKTLGNSDTPVPSAWVAEHRNRLHPGYKQQIKVPL